MHEFEEEMCKLFPPQWLRDTAKETGLVERKRKVDPVAIFWVLILSFGVGMQRTLASLKRSYEREGDIVLSDSSWYERFSPELVLYLKTCVIHGIEYLARTEHRKLSDKLRHFQDVLIQDSTIIRLHKALAKKWPAARARKVAAGVKVGVLVSAVANSIKTVSLVGERTHDIKTLRIGPWVKNRILLIDLGFYKHHVFTRIVENGGFFVSRLKGTADPMIVSVNSICRGRSIDVVGKRVSEVVPKLKRQIVDVEVEVQMKRRRYEGKQRKDAVRFRMIAVYNKEEKTYHLYLANIPSDLLTADDIVSLYGARWEVELIFKELKSRYALDMIKTTNAKIVEALILVAILTLLVSRLIYNLVRQIAESKGREVVRFTHLRWSTIFSETAGKHLTALLHYLNIKMDLMDFYTLYDCQAFDPHVNRQRFREEWWA
ncbi:MAG: IS4 family transposase [Candidatus Nitrosotenuis sp.]